MQCATPLLAIAVLVLQIHGVDNVKSHLHTIKAKAVAHVRAIHAAGAAAAATYGATLGRAAAAGPPPPGGDADHTPLFKNLPFDPYDDDDGKPNEVVGAADFYEAEGASLILLRDELDRASRQRTNNTEELRVLRARIARVVAAEEAALAAEEEGVAVQLAAAANNNNNEASGPSTHTRTLPGDGGAVRRGARGPAWRPCFSNFSALMQERRKLRYGIHPNLCCARKFAMQRLQYAAAPIKMGVNVGVVLPMQFSYVAKHLLEGFADEKDVLRRKRHKYYILQGFSGNKGDYGDPKINPFLGDAREKLRDGTRARAAARRAVAARGDAGELAPDKEAAAAEKIVALEKQLVAAKKKLVNAKKVKVPSTSKVRKKAKEDKVEEAANRVYELTGAIAAASNPAFDRMRSVKRPSGLFHSLRTKAQQARALAALAEDHGCALNDLGIMPARRKFCGTPDWIDCNESAALPLVVAHCRFNSALCDRS